jgi:CheY-like chemotaxis protein
MEEHRRRVLVIDDRFRFGSLIARVLGADYDVLVVPSAESALERAVAGERYDLLLCDLIMPGLSGIDFHERLGSIAPELSERVVFVTVGATSEHTKAFLEQPAIHWIEKPFSSLAAFRAAVQEHLQRLGGGGPAQGGGSP